MRTEITQAKKAFKLVMIVLKEKLLTKYKCDISDRIDFYPAEQLKSISPSELKKCPFLLGSKRLMQVEASKQNKTANPS
jgi:hypothetical protein